jgi:antitoxin MazE
MNIQISKWGHSLALRIPSELLKEAHLKEGDSVSATMTPDGAIALRSNKTDRKSLIRELQNLRDSMPLTKSVINSMRNSSRY